GFSETKTSNLLTVALFLERDKDGLVQYTKPEYEGYGYSQLIELDQIAFYDRRYVNPSMSVSDLRLVSKYMKTGHFATDWKGSDYNVLSRAQEFERRKKAEVEEKKRIQDQVKEYRKDVLPGQIEITSLPQENSDVGNASVGGAKEEVEESIFEALRLQSEFSKLLKTRDGRREFLSRYSEWKHVGRVELLDNEEVYEYVFKNGTKVHAVECNVLTVFEPYLMYDVQARFYICTEPFKTTFIQLSKAQLETWCASHVDEL
ncbi:MAG: hypothetical protein IIX01_01825, partial [Clostridia bacterium]|nr:hypothetical protein [Clostridia bacterium]